MPRSKMSANQGTELLRQLSLSAVSRVFPQTKVKSALKKTKKDSQRIRLLPAIAVVYLVILFTIESNASIEEIVRIMLEPLRRLFGIEMTKVPAKPSISTARVKLGHEPLQHLYQETVKPIANRSLKGCFWNDYRLVAVDGTTVSIQDTEANREKFGIHHNQHGPVGYPQIKVVSLMECGTRVQFDFNYGRINDSEQSLFEPLKPSLNSEMLLLADRGFYSFLHWRDCSKVAGALLWRVKLGLNLPIIKTFKDGSYLSEIKPSSKAVKKGNCNYKDRITVRVVEYVPKFEDGSEGEKVRLLTTILSPKEATAQELAGLYPQRWDIEVGYDEFKTHLKGSNRILRSQRPDLVEQELYGFFLAYFAIRKTIADAAKVDNSSPASFSFVHSVRVIARKISFFPEASN